MRGIPTRLRLRAFPAPFTRRMAPVGGDSRRRAARAAVLWLLPSLALCFTLGWTAADAFAPSHSDPDYGARRDLLRARIAERPGHRLGIVLGSSRMATGFAPETLETPTDLERRPVLWFNSAQVGSGPVQVALVARRLLRDGIRPDVAVVEINPPFFTRENNGRLFSQVDVLEWPLVRNYGPPEGFAWHAASHRATHPGRWRRAFDPRPPTIVPFPQGGWPLLRDDLPTAGRAARLAGEAPLLGELARELTARPAADRALRDTVTLLQATGCRVVLLLAPEASEMRGWYAPDRLAAFETYLARVCREYGVRLIDARLWLADADFIDAHHPLRRGAVAFTARFGREVAGE